MHPGLQSCNSGALHLSHLSVQAFSEIPQLWNMRGNSRIQLQGNRLSGLGSKGRWVVLCSGPGGKIRDMQTGLTLKAISEEHSSASWKGIEE